MRCKACNDSMNVDSRSPKDEKEDLCYLCRCAAFDIGITHEYTLGVLTSSLKTRIRNEGSIAMEEI